MNNNKKQSIKKKLIIENKNENDNINNVEEKEKELTITKKIINYICKNCNTKFSKKINYNSHKILCEKSQEKTEEKCILNYSSLSYTLTKNINKQEKKNNGIYFTPPKTIKENLDFLEPYIKNIKNVLEPSCGSCEYILLLDKQYNDLNLDITGIELNKTIYDSIKKIEKDNIKIYNENYLSYNNSKTYDLIIGNPPYFVMKKHEVPSLYYDYFDGRPNIFILFIIKSLQLLNPNGILSFVLPKNFLNCLYYDKTRKYISKYYKILTILETNNNYIETTQDTIILIIQNNIDNLNNKEYILDNNIYTIFGTSENINKLKYLYDNSSTLTKLGFKVNVGNIVWNQNKEILTDDITKTLLIYSSDIKNNKLNIQSYSNKDKKNYINKQGFDEPILVINRGYGVGNYNFEYCLIEGGFQYLIENHLICIKYTQTIDNKDLIILYNKIIKSLENEKTKQFINLYFGNNAINTTELSDILPIYDI